MTELKAYIAPTPDGTGLADYYLKSEADKVIAELNQKLQDPCIHCPVKEQEADVLSEKDKEVRHHKYKRCLAMAKWCGYFANYWECCEPPDCGAFIARAKFNRKWHKRWLKLAEKFKEAK